MFKCTIYFFWDNTSSNYHQCSKINTWLGLKNNKKKEKNIIIYFSLVFFDISLTKLSKRFSLSIRLSSPRGFSSEAAIANSNSFFFTFHEIKTWNYILISTKIKQGTRRFITISIKSFKRFFLFSLIRNLIQSFYCRNVKVIFNLIFFNEFK